MTFQEQLDKANNFNAFMIHNHIRAVSVNETEAVCEADAGPHALNHMGTVHGSMLMSLAEVTAGLMTKSDSRRYVSVEAGFRFIAGGKAGEKLIARAEIVKRGRTLAFIRTRVYQNEKLLLEGDVTFFCMGE